MNKEKILVSVIMSTYNDEKYIKESLLSMLYQTYRNIEIILIDDCSTDRTAEIVNELKDDRIHYYKRDRQYGLTKNLNYAIHLSKGEYIARMDADDISLPTRIEKQVNALQTSDCKLVGTGIQMFGEYHGYNIPSCKNEELKSKLLMNTALPHPSIMFTRKIISEGKIFYNESYRYAQDFDFLFRVSQKYKISCLQEILLLYRTHKKQISLGHDNEQRLCAETIRQNNLIYLGIDLTKQETELWNVLCRSFGEVKCNITVSDALLADIVLSKIYYKLEQSQNYDMNIVYDMFFRCYKTYRRNLIGNEERKLMRHYRWHSREKSLIYTKKWYIL